MCPASGSLQAVFFDLGYTLINFEGDYPSLINESYLALARSLIQSGYPLNEVTFASRFDAVLSEYYQTRDQDMIERPVDLTLARVLNSFGHPEPPRDVIHAALAEMYHTTESHWQPLPGLIDVLTQLQQQGYRLGLISNAANADNANRLIDRFRLRPFFEVILISAVEKIRKPDVRIYARALTCLGVSADSAVMVGDTLTADILGAQNAGLRAVWITTRADHPENTRALATIKPHAVINELAALPTALNQLK